MPMISPPWRAKRSAAAALPSFWLPFDGDYPYAGIHDQVVAHARSIGAFALDALPPLRGVDTRVLAVPGDGHPNEAGHVRLAAILALGVPAAGVLVFELLFGAANLVEHANLELPRRAELWVRRALVTPSLHRAHHAASWRELDTNFGTILSVWDQAGGTLRANAPGRHVATGLPGGSGAASTTHEAGISARSRASDFALRVSAQNSWSR